MSTFGARFRKGFNRTFQGGNLELYRFGFYLLFPIGFMYYFGMGLEEDIERNYLAHLKREERRELLPRTSDEWRALLQERSRMRAENNQRLRQELLDSLTDDERAEVLAKESIAAKEAVDKAEKRRQAILALKAAAAEGKST
ncbi:uncharacterized protein V1518DRAFT_415781 [Limtongia smithiae]|uniref:uncharacterized protein n=1 Tax=Limtongia smithiae TaxID=1125753 RepID=UPI0034CE452B